MLRDVHLLCRSCSRMIICKYRPLVFVVIRAEQCNSSSAYNYIVSHVFGSISHPIWTRLGTYRSSLTISVKLRPGKSTLLVAGAYSFTMEEVKLIYSLYPDNKLSLCEIKESNFHEAQIEEIAVAISHAFMDIQKIPYDKRPRLSYDPSIIDLSEYRVGNCWQ